MKLTGQSHTEVECMFKRQKSIRGIYMYRRCQNHSNATTAPGRDLYKL